MSSATRPQRVTLEAVAKATGLGRTTVSDILNRGAGAKYSAETQRRVARAVKKLGYAPSRAAQQLARGRSGQIGLLLTRDFSNPYFARLADAVEREVRHRKYRLQLAVTDGDAQSELAHIRRLQSDGVEGLIVAPVYEPKDLDEHQNLLRSQLPVVLLGGRLTDYDSVAADDAGGGRIMIEHLLAMGHRRIAALCVPDRDLDQAFETRFAAYRDVLRGHDQYDTAWVFRQPDHGRFEDSRETAQQFVGRWLNTPASDRPTAVFCHNDQSAMVALSAFHEAGIRVPTDLSVVGYDNLPESRYLTPALTTIDNRVEQQVASAVRLLTERIARPDREPRAETVCSELVARHSVRGIDPEQRSRADQ